MDHPQKMHTTGFAFLCCGLGMLTAAVVAAPLPWLGVALPFIGLGVVFLARSRKAG
jgi:hypothetical protein